MSQPVYVWDSRTNDVRKVEPAPDKSIEDMSLPELLASVEWRISSR